MLQLNPPLPLLTPKGKGYAHFLIDYSQEHDLLWVCFINGTGECWTFRNADIRLEANLSLGHALDDQSVQQRLAENSVQIRPVAD